eukprot:TRINITY_DN9635_c0_g1_i1.p1 TRINITY_DN9635_c0_g1~~TRINITY_DN9635_c0_g1_i1.p1  ORF type:complete len:223 (+),score=51.38 TRINITY_DN9635_c0_g1_i1:76-744(+)
MMISNFKEEPLPENSQFVKPRRLKFDYNGNPRVWDSCLCHNGVCCVIYHKEKDSLIFVQQFRPPVYNVILKELEPQTKTTLSEEAESKASSSQILQPYTGFTHELCAGICDKNTSQEHIIQEEVLEECGYNAPVESFEKVGSFRTAVGVLGYNTTMFYVEVDESMKVTNGGGIDTEDIQLVFIPVKDLDTYIFDASVFSKDSDLQMGVLWYLRHKSSSQRSK